MIAFGLNSLGNYGVSYLNRSVDKLLIGARFGTRSLGFYTQSYNLFVVPINQLTYPLTSVAVASLSRLIDQPNDYKRYFTKALMLLAVLGMPLSGILALAGADLIHFLLGDAWIPAGRLFRLLAVGIGMSLLYATNGWIHLSLGRADRWFRWSIFATAFTVGMFVIGSTHGPEGIAAAYALSFYVLLVPGLLYAGRPIGLDLRLIVRATARPTISSAVAAFLWWSLSYRSDPIVASMDGFAPFWRFSLVALGYFATYVAMLLVLHGGTGPLRLVCDTARVLLPKRWSRRSGADE